MKTGDLARLFGVSVTTIQNWTSEFDTFLSDTASKKRGKLRIFNDNDTLVMATVAKLSADGLNYDAIRGRLNDGELVEHPGVANYGVDTRMIPAAAVEQMIDASEIRVELEIVKSERDKLAQLLDAEQAEHRETRKELEARLQTAQDEITKLNREIGRLEGRLNRDE